jgi:hypothetical protein
VLSRARGLSLDSETALRGGSQAKRGGEADYRLFTRWSEVIGIVAALRAAVAQDPIRSKGRSDERQSVSDIMLPSPPIRMAATSWKRGGGCGLVGLSLVARRDIWLRRRDANPRARKGEGREEKIKGVACVWWPELPFCRR